MRTFLQERQQTKLSKLDRSLLEERDSKRITYLRDKRVLLKKSRRGIL